MIKSYKIQYSVDNERVRCPGGTQFFFFFFFFFFGGCVPRGFQNVGSRERIFLKKWGSWERTF